MIFHEKCNYSYAYYSGILYTLQVKKKKPSVFFKIQHTCFYENQKQKSFSNNTMKVRCFIVESIIRLGNIEVLFLNGSPSFRIDQKDLCIVTRTVKMTSRNEYIRSSVLFDSVSFKCILNTSTKGQIIRRYKLELLIEYP